MNSAATKLTAYKMDRRGSILGGDRNTSVHRLFQNCRMRDSHRGGYECSWDTTQRSPSKLDRRVGGTNRLHLQGRRISQTTNQPESRCLYLPHIFTLVSCFAYYSTVKTETTYSSETLLEFQRATWHEIPEDRTLFGSELTSGLPNQLHSLYRGIFTGNLNAPSVHT
jgi:hypothetical protein